MSDIMEYDETQKSAEFRRYLELADARRRQRLSQRHRSFSFSEEQIAHLREVLQRELADDMTRQQLDEAIDAAVQVIVEQRESARLEA